MARVVCTPARFTRQPASTDTASGTRPSGPAPVRSGTPWASSQPPVPKRSTAGTGAPPLTITSSATTASTDAYETIAAQPAVMAAASSTGARRPAGGLGGLGWAGLGAVGVSVGVPAIVPDSLRRRTAGHVTGRLSSCRAPLESEVVDQLPHEPRGLARRLADPYAGRLQR